MANIDKPAGARVVGHLDGSPYTGAGRRYHIPATDSTATFVGDFVKSAGSADADGVPTIAQAAATDTILGVILSFEADPDNDSTLNRTASTSRYAMVADEPDIVVHIQEDAVGGALAATDIGNNCDITVGTGDTNTGLSAMEIDSSDAQTTSAQLRVLRLVRAADNEIGANAVYECMINEHERKSTTGT